MKSVISTIHTQVLITFETEKKHIFLFTELMLQLRAPIHQILDSVAADINQDFSYSLCSEQSMKKKKNDL